MLHISATHFPVCDLLTACCEREWHRAQVAVAWEFRTALGGPFNMCGWPSHRVLT
jgi:hypothetical protein